MVTTRWTARLLGLCLLATPWLAAAEQVNPARAHVQAVRAAHAQRLGLSAAPMARAPVQPEVIGGTTAPPGSYPAMVALLFAQEADNARAFYCGGTLISSRHVLTAAHCVDFLPLAEVAVLVGTQSLATGGQRFAAADVAIHPQWNPDLVVNDVAVLTLQSDVTGITPMRFIAGESAEDRFAAVGAPVRVAGWGDTSASGASSTELQHAAMAVESQVCNGPSAMCAGSPNHAQAVCFGDSGGPLFSERLVRGRRVQVGVGSFVLDVCGTPGLPDGFARLATLGAWVKQQVGR